MQPEAGPEKKMPPTFQNTEKITGQKKGVMPFAIGRFYVIYEKIKSL
jgi:hypothetical protein